MEEMAIPEHLRSRIKKYYDYLWLNKRYDNGGVFFNDHLLSDALKKEVAREVARVMVPWKSFRYSADIPEDALAALVMAMKCSVIQLFRSVGCWLMAKPCFGCFAFDCHHPMGSAHFPATRSGVSQRRSRS